MHQVIGLSREKQQSEGRHAVVRRFTLIAGLQQQLCQSSASGGGSKPCAQGKTCMKGWLIHVTRWAVRLGKATGVKSVSSVAE